MAEIKVHGLPGTGKTTFGADYVKDRGFNRETILAETFRKQLAQDFANKLGMGELPWCTTTHGICRRLLDTKNVVTDKGPEQSKFCNEVMRIEHSKNLVMRGIDGGQEKLPLGDALFGIRGWLMGNMLTARHWMEAPGADRRSDLSEDLVKEFNAEWDNHLNEKDAVDYELMLQRAYDERLVVPDIKYYFADEFQDKTPLQNELYKIWRKDAENVVIAGDPYQTIYTYQGATPAFFNEAEGELTVLKDSWRLSPAHWEYAKRILFEGGYDKVPELMAHSEGEVMSIGKGNFRDTLNKLRSEEVFILTRARFMARQLVGVLDDLGIPFSSSTDGVMGWTAGQIAVFNALNKLKHYYHVIDPKTHFYVWSGDSLSTDELKALSKFFRAGAFMVPKVKIQHMEDAMLKPSVVAEKVSGAFIDALRAGSIPVDLGMGAKARSLVKIANAFDQHASVIRNDPVLGVSPRVYLGTIHSAKGREADNVFLFDSTTQRIVRDVPTYEEARVFFVGATRTKKRLFVVRNYFNMEVYPLPW